MQVLTHLGFLSLDDVLKNLRVLCFACLNPETGKLECHHAKQIFVKSAGQYEYVTITSAGIQAVKKLAHDYECVITELVEMVAVASWKCSRSPTPLCISVIHPHKY
jgi:hypothetical protein